MGEKIKSLIPNYLKEIDFSVAPLNDAFEKDLLSKFPELQIQYNPSTYRREGYTLSNVFGQKFVYDWLSDYKKTRLFSKISSKLTNSGMSAIDLVLHTLSLNDSYCLIAHKHIYYASSKIIDSYQQKLFAKVCRPETVSEIKSELNGTDMKKILYLEICSNNSAMTFFKQDILIDLAKRVDYLILDGTIVGLPKLNPEIFEQGNIIYVESLSKNYHDCESSQFTAGIVIYPKQLEDQINERFAFSGVYLPIQVALELPVDLYNVGKQRIFQISKNVQEFHSMLSLSAYKQFGFSEFDNKLNRVPLLYFLNLNSNENLKQFIEVSDLPVRSSFGHEETCLLPLGLMFDTELEGLLRIAFGRKNRNNILLESLRTMLG